MQIHNNRNSYNYCYWPLSSNFPSLSLHRPRLAVQSHALGGQLSRVSDVLG